MSEKLKNIKEAIQKTQENLEEQKITENMDNQNIQLSILIL